MLTLFTTVRSFPYAKDIKEKHKIKSSKSKCRSLPREIKNFSSSKDMGYWMLHQSQLQSQAITLNICQNKTNIFLRRYVWILNYCQILYLDYCGLVGLRQCLGPQPGLGTQPYYEAPGDLCIEIVETQWLNIR